MEELGLDLSNILSAEELEALNSTQEETKQETAPGTKQETQEEVINTENLEASDLFGSESVGDNGGTEDIHGQATDTSTQESKGTPPKNNLYSSIAEAFQVDGIFSDLTDDEISKIQTAEDFAGAVEKQIQAKFDERQRRIDKALNNGIEPQQIQVFETSIANLNKITEDNLKDESDAGINLRKNLIVRDYLNRGYDEQKALALAQRSFDAKTDVEDAKFALQQNKDFYQQKYKELQDAAENSAKTLEENRKKEIAALKKLVLEGDKAFGELTVDAKTRQRVYDVISKPICKDPDRDGEFLTEIQKYEKENHNEFMKNLGYLYVVTDGFKTLGNLTKTIEKKVTRKGIKELEHLVNTTTRNPDGSLRMVSGVSDNESYLSGGWSLDTNN